MGPHEAMPHGADLVGIAVAVTFYVFAPALPARLSQNFGGLYRFVLNKWYFDELYDAIFVKPTLRIAKFAWHFGDEQVIDGDGFQEDDFPPRCRSLGMG